MLLLNVAKVVLTAAAMTCLYVFFLFMGSSSHPADPSVEGGYAIGWILIPALCAVGVFIVSILSGLLFTKDRWIVRPAATALVLFCLSFLTLSMTDIVSPGLNSETISYVQQNILPMVIAGVIAFLFSPLFHDCGRALRNRLRRNQNLGGKEMKAGGTTASPQTGN